MLEPTEQLAPIAWTGSPRSTLTTSTGPRPRYVTPSSVNAKVTTIAGGVPLPDECPREFAAAVLAFVDALP